jgi:hypothetical protein
VKWFAFTYGSTSASGDFHPGTNPGFEGTAFLESSTVPEPSTVREPSTVPEPSTVILLGTGLLGLGFMSWRRKEEED